MSDLISRSELTESIKRQYCTGCDNYNGVRCRACHADDMLSLVDDAADAMPRWISVEEGLPKRYEHVLVSTRFTDEGEPDTEIAYLSLGGWRKPEGVLYGKVTHWMPLPEPPMEE